MRAKIEVICTLSIEPHFRKGTRYTAYFSSTRVDVLNESDESIEFSYSDTTYRSGHGSYLNFDKYFILLSEHREEQLSLLCERSEQSK